jgi:hypothetical protein
MGEGGKNLQKEDKWKEERIRKEGGTLGPNHDG